MRQSRRARGDGEVTKGCKTMKISALDMSTRKFDVSAPPHYAEHLPLSGRSTLPLVADDTPSWRRSPSSTPLKPSRSATYDELLAGDLNPDSTPSAISLAVCIGQCFSLLPVNTQTRNVPRFHWCSLRVFYTFLVTLGLFIYLGLTMYDTYKAAEREQLSPIVAANGGVFYVCAIAVSVLYIRLALRWRSLSLSFLRVEDRMSSDGSPPHLRLRLTIITIAVLILALVEHTLSHVKQFMGMDLRNLTISEGAEEYFTRTFLQVSRIFPFNPVLAVITVMLHIMATFMWNYNDLFIMLISVAIAQRFRMLHRRLMDSITKDKSESYWRRARETYNDLSHLTRDADSHLSPHVLLSFVNNLFFICLQLLHTVSNEGNTLYQNIYFLYSFGFLLIRTCAVSLFAATIHDESKAIKGVLYAVSSRSYCTEVDRFLAQATSDEIALTGMKFFKVTRSFLLTMAGTITTYEIVLMQFNPNIKDN